MSSKHPPGLHPNPVVGQPRFEYIKLAVERRGVGETTFRRRFDVPIRRSANYWRAVVDAATGDGPRCMAASAEPDPATDPEPPRCRSVQAGGVQGRQGAGGKDDAGPLRKIIAQKAAAQRWEKKG